MNGRDVGPVRAFAFEGTGVRQLQSVALVRERAESDANARLIAAAPELLNACRRASDWIANHGDTLPASAMKLSAVLTAAIVKAEGAPASRAASDPHVADPGTPASARINHLSEIVE